jgi:hypothetical protein
MLNVVRAISYGVFAGGILALTIIAPKQIGAIAQEPVDQAIATIDKLFPEPVDLSKFHKYKFTFDDSVSTDVQRTQVVTKIGHGRKSQVTIVTTPSGTYSTDGMLSPNVRYPGIEKRLKPWPEDFYLAEGGKWMSYADGSFIYLVFRVPAERT